MDPSPPCVYKRNPLLRSFSFCNNKEEENSDLSLSPFLLLGLQQELWISLFQQLLLSLVTEPELSLFSLIFSVVLKETLSRKRFDLIEAYHIEIMAKEEEPQMLLRDHYILSTYTSPSCLQLPQATATHYEIKSSIIHMLPSFHGLNNEDPYKHLDEFLEICSTIKL
jgi:hypothetical protein